jgi:hypothetical protein
VLTRCVFVRQVFLVSSVFHHVALVRLDVHKSMLNHLERLDPSEQVAAGCWGLKVLRTRWYDLFESADRVEAMRVIWGAFGWMMRDTDAERAQREARENTPMPDA